MKIQQTLSLFLALCLCASAASPQDGEQSPLEKAREAQRQKQLEAEGALMGADGKPVLPGQLPVGASAEAKAAWTEVLEKSGAGRPIRSFELSFFLRQRDPENPQTNDLDLRFSYLVPGYVRAILESGRTLLRGPRGDYLIDAGETIQLVGREGIEDIKQIDQMASLARNFVSLSNPRNLRLVELSLMTEAPAGMPSSFQPQLTGLRWLRLVSPDFFLRPEQPRQSGGSTQLYSVALGVDPESQEIRFAVLHEQRPRINGEAGTALVNATATLVRLTEYVERNSFQVPHKVQVFGIDGTRLPARFSARPTSELTLRRKRGSLRPGLRPTDFHPPR